ncbi:hypothetical protein LXL04_004446 [Taraxacum kok-saghyz]
MEKFEEFAWEFKEFLTTKIFPYLHYLNVVMKTYLDYLADKDKPTYAQIIFAASIGLIIAGTMHIRLRKVRTHKIIPWIRVSKNRRPLKLERFPHYVVRQMGFDDEGLCPYLCKLASDYIRKEEGCEGPG